MERFIIYVNFNGQNREALVQYIPAYQGSNIETFSIHPVVKSEHFISFGKQVLKLESNRPLWRRKGVGATRRPDYKLIQGTIKYKSYEEALIAALDLWVRRNLDV